MRITSLVIIIIDLLLTNLIKQTNKQTNIPANKGKTLLRNTHQTNGKTETKSNLKKGKRKKTQKTIRHYNKTRPTQICESALMHFSHFHVHSYLHTSYQIFSSLSPQFINTSVSSTHQFNHYSTENISKRYFGLWLLTKNSALTTPFKVHAFMSFDRYM